MSKKLRLIPKKKYDIKLISKLNGEKICNHINEVVSDEIKFYNQELINIEGKDFLYIIRYFRNKTNAVNFITINTKEIEVFFDDEDEAEEKKLEKILHKVNLTDFKC